MRGRRIQVLAAVAGLIGGSVAVVLAPQASWADSSVGSFEIDGNKADSAPGEPVDWNDATTGSPPVTVTPFTDGSGTGKEDGFAGHSANNSPVNWACDNVSTPDKDDIVDGAIAFRTIGTDQFVYMNFDRIGNNGTADLDFELNKGSGLHPSPPCQNILPARTNGDLIIAFDQQGQTSTSADVHLYRWVGNASSGVLEELTTAGLFQGQLDAGRTFGEAALNISAALGRPIACGEFATSFMKSRASTSINSDLKDRTETQPVNLGSCPNSSLDKAVRNYPGGTFANTANASPGDTLEYQLVYNNAGPAAATNVVVTDTLQPRQTLVAVNPCTPACTVNGSTLQWTFASVPANTQQVITFRVTLDATFPAGTTYITNQGAVDTQEEPSKLSDTTTTTVTAAPNVTRTKTASPNPANPGQVVTYTITYTNTGNADKTFASIVDNYDQAHIQVNNATINPAGTNNGDTITWTNITVPAQGSRTLTYQGTVIGTFSGPSGGGGCQPGQFPVVNTVTDSQGSFSATLCVNAPQPNLTITKTACPTPVVPGGVLTYTITFANTGEGPANDVVVTDTVPTGTTFISADGGGTESGGTVTWSVGTLAPNQSGSRTVQVLVTAGNGSSLSNTATISASNATSKSTGAVITPVSNNGASTRGTAYGADADVLVLDLIKELGRVDSQAPGTPAHADSQLLSASVPTLVELGLITNTSDSSVGNEATSTAASQVADVNLLSGAIRADIVRGESTSTADANFATTSSAGSTFANLRVFGVNNGNPITNVAPNTTVDVKNPLFPSQTVARAVLYEEGKSATFANGKFTSTHFVNMIHVTLLKPFLTLPKGAQIIVGHADTSATYPSGLACGTQPGLVSGAAYNAYVNGTVLGNQFTNVQVGDAMITPLGGSDSDGVAANIPGVVTDATVTNEASGSIAGNPNATAHSRAEQVNVLSGLFTGGLVTADVLDVRSTSTTTASSATTNFATTFVGLRVAGLPVSATPAPNSSVFVQLPLGGFAVVVLNEQTASNGIKDTFGTINAVHVYVYNPLGIVTAEVIVAHAHSDAHHP